MSQITETGRCMGGSEHDAMESSMGDCGYSRSRVEVATVAIRHPHIKASWLPQRLHSDNWLTSNPMYHPNPFHEHLHDHHAVSCGTGCVGALHLRNLASAANEMKANGYPCLSETFGHLAQSRAYKGTLQPLLPSTFRFHLSAHRSFCVPQ